MARTHVVKREEKERQTESERGRQGGREREKMRLFRYVCAAVSNRIIVYAVWACSPSFESNLCVPKHKRSDIVVVVVDVGIAFSCRFVGEKLQTKRSRCGNNIRILGTPYYHVFIQLMAVRERERRRGGGGTEAGRPFYRSHARPML